jgi:hypothetical protein
MLYVLLLFIVIFVASCWTVGCWTWSTCATMQISNLTFEKLRSPPRHNGRPAMIEL